MKKSIIMIIVLATLLTGCGTKKTEKIIEDLNANSNFEYELLTVVTDDIESRFSTMNGFGMRILVDATLDPQIDDINDYMDNHPTTYYTVTAYPDDSDGGDFITRIETSDPDIYVYDLKVGDPYVEDQINKSMASLGYLPHPEIQLTYVNDRVRIRVYHHDDLIVKLVVEVEVTNRLGIQF
ncbi:MAG: hypothetical protein K9K93_01875 [Acholeplasmataceae bacterium]|nr:hypothetical protein [Acholeplasmataceae bacterium]